MTTIVDKIRKRIRTREMLEGRVIDEIQITKKEAEQLGDRRIIDNIKLIIVDKLGEMTRTDCFAYIDRNGHKSCYALDKLYCENSKCNFYKTDIKKSKIELDIRRYSEK